jgi:hypothetical protein
MVWKKLFWGNKRPINQREIRESAKELGFTEEVFNVINELANNIDFQAFYQKDSETLEENKMAGISFQSAEEEAEPLIMKLQAKLLPLGYLVFISERNGKRSRIGIIRGSDQFMILKVQQTNGENYNLSNQDVIIKLKEWNQRIPFTIIGADYESVEAVFEDLPVQNDLNTLAEEIYQFCPDIVEQGTGTIEALFNEMHETKKLYLWWD